MEHEALNDSELAIQALRELFRQRGGLAYGEAVTQLEHALQCGAVAEADGAAPALVVAAVLHDVGHFLHVDAAGALANAVDDRHEALGATWLRGWFPDAVTMPIALHVEAKRYLCYAEPAYLAGLSPVSMTTLRLQGGPMSAEAAARFLVRPFAAEAIRLRRYDEAGKVAGARTPPLEHFLAIARTCRAG